MQSVPEAVHSAGGVGHDPQVALPAVPLQPCAHVAVLVTTRHCAASSSQVTTCVFEESQYVPALPLQTAGAAAHVQAALGNDPPQGSVDAQVVLADWMTQPSPSTAQVTNAPDAQTVPAPVQPVGAAGHTQAAEGAVPWQVLRPEQAVAVPQVGQPPTLTQV